MNKIILNFFLILVISTMLLSLMGIVSATDEVKNNSTITDFGNPVTENVNINQQIKSGENLTIEIEDTNTFKLQFSNSTPLIMHYIDINNRKDLNSAINLAKNPIHNNKKIDCLVLNFKENLVFNIDSKEEGSLFDVKVNYLVFNGFNSKIIVKNPDKNDEYHFIYNEGKVVSIDSLTISGFNTAIENKGILNLNKTIFNGNKLDYRFKPDFGGAIKNFGIVNCENCLFINNYAKYGGAIYNCYQVTLKNCTFSNNEGYKHGNDIYDFKEGKSNLINTKASKYYYEGLSDGEKWAMRIGAGALSILAGVGLSFIGLGPIAATAISFAAGAAIGAGEALLEGYLDNDISVKQIIVTALICGSLAAAATTFTKALTGTDLSKFAELEESVNKMARDYGVEIAELSTPNLLDKAELAILNNYLDLLPLIPAFNANTVLLGVSIISLLSSIFVPFIYYEEHNNSTEIKNIPNKITIQI